MKHFSKLICILKFKNWISCILNLSAFIRSFQTQNDSHHQPKDDDIHLQNIYQAVKFIVFLEGVQFRYQIHVKPFWSPLVSFVI